MILCLYSCLEKIDDNVLAATHTLGAGRFRTFIDVVLPQSFSGLLTGILVIFIPVAGSFVEPDTVGGPYSMMIGSLINTQFNVSLNMGYGATLSFLLLVLMSLALAMINLVMKLAERVWLVLTMLLLFVPIALIILMSFNTSKYGTFPFEFTLKWYQQLFAGSELIQSTIFSFWFSLAVSTVSAVLGILASLALRRLSKKWNKAFPTLMDVPVIVPWQIWWLLCPIPSS